MLKKSFIFALLFVSGGLLGCYRHPYGSWIPAPFVPATPVSIQVTVTDMSTLAKGQPLESKRIAGTGIDFGSRNIHAGSSSLLRIDVQNTAQVPVVLTSPVLLGSAANDFLIRSGSPLEPIAPGDRLYFYLSFAPQNVGARQANVQFSYSKVNGPANVYSFSMHGIGSDATMYVSTGTGDDLSDGTAAHPKKTIQAAVNALETPPGLGIDTIVVEPGEYVEQVLIRSSITLVGRDKSTTFVKSPAAPIDLPSTHGHKDLVVISGLNAHGDPVSANAEITGLTLKGPAMNGCAGIFAGIHVRDGAFGYIHDNDIVDIREEPMTGCQNGLAILVGFYNETDLAQLQPAQAFVSDNRISHYQKAGVVLGGSSSGVVIGNQLTSLETNLLASNGIEIIKSTGWIEHNRVSGNLCDYHDPMRPNDQNCGPDALQNIQAAGVLLEGMTQNVQIQNNQLTNNDAGLLVVSSTGLDSSQKQVLVRQNLFSNNRRIHMYTELNSSITQNIFSDSSSGIGLIIVPGLSGLHYPFVTAKENHIVDSLIGVQVLDDPGIPAGTQTIAVFSENNIEGATASIKNESSVNVDARHNYFGRYIGVDAWLGSHIQFDNYTTLAFPIPNLSF